MLIFRKAEPKDMFTVMDIRNSGREFMTHDTREITYEEQYDWWINKEGYDIWLVYLDIPGDSLYVLGFAMIHATPQGNWATVCLYPEYRGKGHATAIYEFLTEQADTVWVEIQKNNISALYAALNAGFIVQWQKDDVITLVCRKENA